MCPQSSSNQSAPYPKPFASFSSSSHSFRSCLLFNAMLPLSLLLVVATFIATAISQKCYGLDGTVLDDTFAPCKPTAKHSGCCATKRTSGSADLCLDNGLCMATSDELVGTIWQKGCTDSTGKDEACPKMCPDGIAPTLP